MGPKSNPAKLNVGDDVLTLFNQIVEQGNKDLVVGFSLFATGNLTVQLPQTPPSNRPTVRFLSRFDKSATNIKESELYCKIGQVCLRSM